MKNFLRITALFASLMLASFALFSCSNGDSGGDSTDPIVGGWVRQGSSSGSGYYFSKDGKVYNLSNEYDTYHYNSSKEAGTWLKKDGNYTIILTSDSGALTIYGGNSNVSIMINGNFLYFIGGDINRAFSKVVTNEIIDDYSNSSSGGGSSNTIDPIIGGWELETNGTASGAGYYFALNKKIYLITKSDDTYYYNSSQSSTDSWERLSNGEYVLYINGSTMGGGENRGNIWIENTYLYAGVKMTEQSVKTATYKKISDNKLIDRNSNTSSGGSYNSSGGSSSGGSSDNESGGGYTSGGDSDSNSNSGGNSNSISGENTNGYGGSSGSDNATGGSGSNNGNSDIKIYDEIYIVGEPWEMWTEFIKMEKDNVGFYCVAPQTGTFEFKVTGSPDWGEQLFLGATVPSDGSIVESGSDMSLSDFSNARVTIQEGTKLYVWQEGSRWFAKISKPYYY